MDFTIVLSRLEAYRPPPDWPSHLFLLPKGAMGDIHAAILETRARSCLELGTGFGATTCVMAAACEATGGNVTTIDMWLHQPVGVKVLLEHTGLGKRVDVAVDPLGYNWVLLETIRKQTRNGRCEPLYDFCLLDGAHEFQPDALAFTLAAKLLKPGALLVVDDLNLTLRGVPGWEQFFAGKTDRELDTPQMELLWEYVIKQHPDFEGFRLTEGGRIGWARKRAAR